MLAVLKTFLFNSGFGEGRKNRGAKPRRSGCERGSLAKPSGAERAHAAWRQFPRVDAAAAPEVQASLHAAFGSPVVIFHPNSDCFRPSKWPHCPLKVATWKQKLRQEMPGPAPSPFSHDGRPLPRRCSLSRRLRAINLPLPAASKDKTRRDAPLIQKKS